jgi:hypothetical protein
MSLDLRTALLQAGLVDPQQAKQAEADQRQRGRRPDRDPRRPDAARFAHPCEPGPHDDDATALQLAADGAIKLPLRGTRRWYFVARDKTLRFAAVSDELARRLEEGTVALVEAPDGTISATTAEFAERVRQVAPGWLRFWNGGGK